MDIDEVRITTGDTDSAPLTGLSAGSKTIYTVGAAVMQAAEDARRQTLEIAASEMEAAVQDLEIEDGKVSVRGVPSRSITLAQIGKKGNLYMSKVPPVLGVSHIAFAVQAPAFAAQLARVEVDPDTGELTLHEFVVVQDAGKAINPLGVEGQMQGGAVQSLGFALTEGLLFDEKGRLTNPSLLDYRKLTAADLPKIETIIVEVPSPAGPFGARGVGEPPIVPAPAAIANAVFDATGARITELPITPERIAMALRRGAGERPGVEPLHQVTHPCPASGWRCRGSSRPAPPAGFSTGRAGRPRASRSRLPGERQPVGSPSRSRSRPLEAAARTLPSATTRVPDFTARPAGPDSIGSRGLDSHSGARHLDGPDRSSFISVYSIIVDTTILIRGDQAASPASCRRSRRGSSRRSLTRSGSGSSSSWWSAIGPCRSCRPP